MASKNAKMHAAKSAKNDEFYTRLEDIEKELIHYRDHFRDKTIFLNCDDPSSSMFWVYFQQNFDHLGLKKLISTHFHATEPTYMQTITRGVDRNGDGTHGEQDIVRTPLSGNGDFRSPECISLLEESDIVVTNPPFSLFREYIAQLVEYEKDFIILGNMNAITYKEVWQHIQAGRVWLGVTANGGECWFRVPDSYEHSRNMKVDGNGVRRIGVGVRWFTTLDHSRRHEEIVLFREYSPDAYPKYDNYDAIEVSKVADIPVDYDGLMGVPITFLGKHNPGQFEVVGQSANGIVPEWMKLPHFKRHNEPYVSGRKVYQRIFVRRSMPAASG